MALQALTSRAVIGDFYRRLEENTGATWVGPTSMLFQSNQPIEEYAWLGMSPKMREWVGGRLAKGLKETTIRIPNKWFEATLEVYLDDLRRDKSGQLRIRIAELARRTQTHWAQLLNTLILNGQTALAYDGQAFFSTTHAEDDSGTQSNHIQVNVSDANAPTAAEMETAILRAVTQIMAIKDNTGEPMNEDANSFLVMVPTSMMAAAAASLRNPVIVDTNGSRTNTITNLGGFSFELAINPRLTATDEFYVFRSDSMVRAFIRQEEQAVRIDAVAEGSEEEFKNRRHLYGVTAIRNVGYGMWQEAVLVELT